MSGSNQTKGKDSVWTMIKLGLILAAYAVACCTVLAIVNNITAPVIAQNQQKKASSGMAAVFEQAEEFEPAEIPASGDGTTCDAMYLAKAEGNVIGAVVQITGATYDHSTIIVGMTVDGVITGMQYLENTDTPGFGQKASDPTFKLASGQTFYGQFAGKKVSDGFIAGETFDAISGATITSNGAGTLMTQAAQCMTEALKEYK
ncbi:MAG: FMN-binding protein [Treponema sp.]|nr:FMN-binding protein [Treponema sp.]